MTQTTVFDSEKMFLLEGKCDAKSMIAKIDQIIAALLVVALNSAGTSDMGEYFLNDGQTTIKAVYRNPAEVQATIQKYRQLKNDLAYDSGLVSRITRSVDRGAFR